MGLLRLAELTGEAEYERQALGVLALLRDIAPRHPTSFGHLLQVLHWRLVPRAPDRLRAVPGTLQNRQVAIQLPLGDVHAVVVPLLALDLDVAVEHVLAERPQHQLGLRRQLDRFAEALRQLLDAETARSSPER